MRTKLNLNEEETKRILSLHNKKIQNQKDIFFESKSLLDVGKEKLKKQGIGMVKGNVLTLSDNITLENAQNSIKDELKLFKGAKFKKVSNNEIVSETSYSFVDSSTGRQNGSINRGKISYSCSTGKFKILGTGSKDTYFNEDYMAAYEAFKYLCTSTNQGSQQNKENTGGGGKSNTYVLQNGQVLTPKIKQIATFNVPKNTTITFYPTKNGASLKARNPKGESQNFWFNCQNGIFTTKALGPIPIPLKDPILA